MTTSHAAAAPPHTHDPEHASFDAPQPEKHESRELMAAQKRRFRLQSETVDCWLPEDQADLDYEIAHETTLSSPAVTHLRPKILPWRSLFPTASVHEDQGPAAPYENPFIVTDKLGRSKPAARWTTGFSLEDLKRSYECLLRANAQWLPMSTHVTITWQTLGLVNEAAVRRVQRAMLDSLRDAAKRWRPAPGYDRDTSRVVWIWVLERSEERGLHSHILFACPPNRRTRLLRLIVKILTRLTGREDISNRHDCPEQDETQPKSAAVVMTAPPPRSNGDSSTYREMKRQWVLWRYIFKGYQPSTAASRGVTPTGMTPRPQGAIVGKRWGHSTCALGEKDWAEFSALLGRPPEWISLHIENRGFVYPRHIVTEPTWY